MQVLYLKLQRDQYSVLQWEQFDLEEDLPSLRSETSTSPAMSTIDLQTNWN